MPATLAALLIASMHSAAPLQDADLKTLIEAVGHPNSLMLRFVCATVEGRDLPSDHSITLSHGRILLPARRCTDSGPYFIEVVSGENAVQIDLSNIRATKSTLEADYRVRDSTEDCAGTLLLERVASLWVEKGNRTFTCTVE